MSAMEKGEVNIRRMESKDIDDVLAVYNRIREARTSGMKPSRLSYKAVLTYEQIACTEPGSPLDLSFVAEVNGQVVGFLWGRLAYVGIPMEEVGLIHMLIVDFDYQRRGIAKRLVDTLTERCQAKGVNAIRAIIDERDWELGNFFHGLGFNRSELAIYLKTPGK